MDEMCKKTCVFESESAHKSFSDSARIPRFATFHAGILSFMVSFAKTQSAFSRIIGVLLVLAALCLALCGCNAGGANQGGSPATSASAATSTASGWTSDSGSVTVYENGTYTSKDEVAAYIHEFGRLPSNFISKTKARKAGWVPSKGNLDEVCPGKSIGGSEFYNDEGRLPDARGRTWKECDINYTGGHRGAERIVFSNDGLVFYTPDHYETFEQLY